MGPSWRARRRWAPLGGVVSCSSSRCRSSYFRAVTVKMLPFDNKSEIQVVDRHAGGDDARGDERLARRLAEVRKLPEVTDVQVYVGTSAPFNFNGLVRHYFLRSGPTSPTCRSTSSPSTIATASHSSPRTCASASRRSRERHGASVKVTEVPPGPPVLSTLVAEIYGPDLDRGSSSPGEVRRDLRGDPRRRRRRLVRRGRRRRGSSWRSTARRRRPSASPPRRSRGPCASRWRRRPSGTLGDGAAREPVPIVLRLDRAQRSEPRRPPRPPSTAPAAGSRCASSSTAAGPRASASSTTRTCAGDLRDRRGRGRRRSRRSTPSSRWASAWRR
jgi:hypothetical protein